MNDKLPQHIAIIMDGNGRWAKMRGMPRTFGHKAGETAVRKVIERCYDKGVKYLSLFAFSTENWSRSKNEVDTLFSILRDFMRKFGKLAIEKGIRITIMGDIEPLPQDLKAEIIRITTDTEKFTKLILNIGLNYGGRAEIVRAANKAASLGETLTEENFKKYLYTSDIPDPDVIVRTSGEYRFSNFMIYQSAYSELYFTDCLWPDFDEAEFDKVLEEYAKRDRRFGKVK